MNRIDTPSAEVAVHLREQIVMGRIAPETYLRLEPIAHEFSLSVTPVREALFQLAAEGFVRFLPRRGFLVLPLTDEDIRDVYEVQAFIAGELAARATLALSRKDVARLQQEQERLEEALAAGRPSDVDGHNHEFHRQINRAAGSERLAAMLRTSTLFAPRQFFSRIEGWSEASATEHHDILQAYHDGDAEAARQAMWAHIIHAGELLAQHRGAPHD
ncbi:GntR family transcriptional regulator [Aeromicrobium sp. YIM 150415]|uniref:GntR family transcriptional regulator n=1 Tax=Aeromicrobium sp. YIM 150415 TaxID=2803912 RepID=UPI0019640CC1|nr:GntR family transcriptional regulator [Aeromicrobium sp. YIM 150415]MBM9464031.1 GntR family transcriptional regulator [Aeromicrobium sp. YIM 150415]